MNQSIVPEPCPIEAGRALAPLTTWRIGGPAAFFAEPETPGQLAHCYAFARERGLPILALGGASNMLVHDRGYRGLVLRYMDREERREERADLAPPLLRLRVGARALLSRLSRQLARQGWGGLEWAEGIPGTLGGAVVGNAGAYGGEMSRVVAEVETFDPAGPCIAAVANADCGFRYRTSRFKEAGAARAFVLGATLCLQKEPAEDLLARLDQIRSRRKAVSPPGLSCGSVFKNPLGDYAGRIVDSLGLKGARVGGAEISELHANYIVNRGGATARDVFDLIAQARSRAREELGIELELEVQLVGFEGAAAFPSAPS